VQALACAGRQAALALIGSYSHTPIWL